MLGAQSEGKRWIAGAIPDPKSREYTCLHCPEIVSHVQRHRRSGRSTVTEHFRHPADASHAVRTVSTMTSPALRRIIEQLDKAYLLEFETDQIFPTSLGDIAVDLLVTEHFSDKEPVQTVVQVESSFRYKDISALTKALSRDGIYFMPVLCAHDSVENPTGKFLRLETRELTGTRVARLSGNERTLVERFGDVGIYFDFNTENLRKVKFGEYSERLPEDVVNQSTGQVVRRRGEIQEYKTLRRLTRDHQVSDGFLFDYSQNIYGERMARPRAPNLGDAIRAEDVAKSRSDTDKAEDIAERIGIYLDGCRPEFLEELTKKYGADALGGYASKI
jgi:hypothetical protein